MTVIGMEDDTIKVLSTVFSPTLPPRWKQDREPLNRLKGRQISAEDKGIFLTLTSRPTGNVVVR